MADKEEKSQFPKEFENCPGWNHTTNKPCGSTRRFAEEVGREKREKGKGIPVLLSAEIIFQGPLDLFPTVAQGLMDICVDCGTVYAKALETRKGVNEPLKPPSEPFLGKRRN